MDHTGVAEQGMKKLVRYSTTVNERCLVCVWRSLEFGIR